MAYLRNRHLFRVIVYLVEDAIVTDAKAVQLVLALELLYAGREWIDTKTVDATTDLLLATLWK